MKCVGFVFLWIMDALYDLLRTSSRGRYEENAFVEFHLYRVRLSAKSCSFGRVLFLMSISHVISRTAAIRLRMLEEASVN